MAFSTSDTIVAVATAPGRAGIGVVRLSGPDARPIAQTLAGAQVLEARRATFTRVRVPGEPAPIDHVVMTWFQAPHSYTGEDVVEVSAHGSPWILQRIVELACAAGARVAEPGEFTLRAYLNGRMDLVQAEAVADLVEAVTPLQARVAMDQLEGTLTRRVADIEGGLFDVIARLEASLDFPDEGFHFITRDDARRGLEHTREGLARLLAEGQRGRLIREGRLVVIAGRPNVGKSSLFNALVGAARAIVTTQAGTTRDLLTEVVDIEGIPITLVDTAGVRDAQDEAEAEGVRRAQAALRTAALTVMVLDGSAPASEEDRVLLQTATGPVVVVVNKTDLVSRLDIEEAIPGSTDAVVQVSARTGDGIDRLRRVILDVLTGGEDLRDTPALSNQRHLECARAALDAVARALDALESGATEELVLAELGDAREILESLTGRRSAEDVLAHIFRHFCIGK